MGIEWEAEDNNCLELINHLNNVVIPNSKNLKNRSIPEGSGIGIKPVSKSGSQRHIRKAIEHAKRLSGCLLYTSPSPRDKRQSRMPSSA